MYGFHIRFFLFHIGTTLGALQDVVVGSTGARAETTRFRVTQPGASLTKEFLHLMRICLGQMASALLQQARTGV